MPAIPSTKIRKLFLLNKQQHMKIKKPNKLSAFFICVLIACLLWLLHTLNTVYTKEIRIPVKFIAGAEMNLKPVRLPDTLIVKVKTSGLKLILMQWQGAEKELSIDINSLIPNEEKTRFLLSSQPALFQHHLGLNAEIRSINPDTLYMNRYTGEGKLIPLRIPVTVRAALGYQITRIVQEPEFVTIYSKEASTMDTLVLAEVLLNNSTESFTHVVSLPKTGKLVVQEAFAKITVQTEKLAEKEWLLPVQVKGETRLHSVVPARVSVRLMGELPLLSAENCNKIQAVASVKEGQTHGIEVELMNVPKGVKVLRIEPKQVELLIKHKKP